MNRRLLLLNVVLVAVAAYAGTQLRRQWQATKAREAAKLNQPARALQPPKYQSIEQPAPVLATTYADIAQKMLFDRSRNPTVVIEVPAPPPPPPMPPLPAFYGIMNLDGPTAILSVATTREKAIRPGERIGEFKLVEVNNEGLAFEWNGQTVRKSIEELTRTRPVSAASQVPAERTDTAAPAAAAAPKPPLVGPGEDFGGYRNCNVNDGNPEGAVKDGHKKVIYPTPFGNACRWEPVAKE